MRTSRTIGTALAVALAACVAAGVAGCQSATKTNLAEYESLVARRRAPSATPMAVRAAQEKAAQEKAAADARVKAAEARAQKAEAEAAEAKRRAAQEKKELEGRRAAEEQRRAAAKAAEEKRKAAEERRAAEEARRAREAEEARLAEEARAREAAEEEEDDDWGEAVEVVAPPAPATAVPAPEIRGEAGGSNTAYVLAVGDAVQIYLRGIPNAEAIEDIIDEGGYVTLPFINEVKAAGCTATQLEKIIRDTYRERRIYKDLSVQVMVPTRYYYMQGEIRGPGRVQLVSAVRLSQAIAANGGGTEFWNGKVVVKRNDGRIVNVKNARRLERTPEEDILLEPGDIVELKRSWF